MQHTFKPFTFIIASDPHIHEAAWQGAAHLKSFLGQVKAHPKAAFILLLGDLFWQRESSELEELLSQANYPIHILYGNHDMERIEEYEAFFGLRDRSFEHNGCLFVLFSNSLGTSPSRPLAHSHAGGCSAAQWAWIEEQLQQGREKDLHHLFLAAHVPPFSSEGYHEGFFLLPEDEKRLRALCQRYGVSACFFGHLHQALAFMLEESQILVSPSLTWNFAPSAQGNQPAASPYQKVPAGSYRLVQVTEEGIRHQIYPLM
jgi:predicted phosphodiesterase